MHLLDGTIGGVLLLELFKRDGMGTMVARQVSSVISSSQTMDILDNKFHVVLLFGFFTPQ